MAERGKKFLLDLMQRPGNEECADCGAKGEFMKLFVVNNCVESY